MSRKLIPAILALALVLALAPGSASAQSVFRSADSIDIPTTGTPAPNPSTLSVEGMRGPVTDIEVSLEGVFHPNPDDLDVMLVAPDGYRVVLMSDACGGADVVNRTWTFKVAPLVPSMPDELSCPGTFYLDTDYAGNDAETFPGSGTGPVVALNQLFRQVQNGQWKLLVFDDTAGGGGAILGWSITLTTGQTAIRIPHQGTSGPANPYPQKFAALTPAEDGPIITDLDVGVPRISHERPDDLEFLLVGPGGQKTLLMSDACGTKAMNDLSLVFDDEAPVQLPDAGPPCGVVVKPTDHEAGDQLPAPAPAGPYSDTLDVFDGTEIAGEWQLFAFDDGAGAEGYTRAPVTLRPQTRLESTVEFAEGSVEITEGERRRLTVRRSAEQALGAAVVDVTSTPGTATAGTDYTPVTRSIAFAAGEREQSVDVGALIDAAGEGPESYSVALRQPSGDARLGARVTVDVAITDDFRVDDAVVCAGRRATIAGTAKGDVLRGTRGVDVIAAGGGSDKVKAGGGRDVVCGGSGRDRLTGGAGRDACSGGAGRDRVRCELKRIK